ncbi:MAG: MFS transporter, partial [Thermoleophilaceae bacterium]
TAFVAIESRTEHPLLPLRVVADRTRGGAYLGIGLAAISMFGVFLFLTYYLQQNKGFTPIQTGLAFLPMPVAIVATSVTVNIKLLNTLGPRKIITFGMLIGAIAMVWFAQITPSTSYAGHILPGLLVLGVGMGSIFAPAFATATYGVEPTDTGVASAMVNTMQQVGGSVGTALLSSIFASAVTSYAEGRQRTPQLMGEASVHGYTVAFWVSAGVFAVGALIVGTVMRPIKVAAEEPVGQPVAA